MKNVPWMPDAARMREIFWKNWIFVLTKQACYAKIAKSGANTRCKMDVWPVGQAVKTEASHAFNIGSIPVRVTIL